MDINFKRAWFMVDIYELSKNAHAKKKLFLRRPNLFAVCNNT
jgi:hypothetical protein